MHLFMVFLQDQALYGIFGIQKRKRARKFEMCLKKVCKTAHRVGESRDRVHFCCWENTCKAVRQWWHQHQNFGGRAKGARENLGGE